MDTLSSIQGQWNELSESRDHWDKIVNALLRPIGMRMIKSLQLTPASVVLDVATGTGEPGLTVAEMFPASLVTGLDISEKMLQLAAKNGHDRRVTNFLTCLSDVVSMPFEDDHFDAVLCRNGVMFFNDIGVGLREMRRVLKKGCLMTISTWGLLDKNLWVAMVLDAAREVTGRKMHNNHVPGMFYCMEPGFMTDWYEAIGMHEIREDELTGIIEFNSADEHWNYVTSVSAAVVNALAGLSEEQREQIREIVKEKITTHIVREKLYFQWTTRITSGVK
ncbi:MAG TPA: class I SAM-dependent methyltransferase [Chitinophaga sp.]|uniref:class I SAM-dependent methyltransferase n=1 Tax=Chitinophaga sp. TaxID=1869181 RepID=UPI002CAD5232|nr:class I SAM-dependent methyltransferase [Chitinophaga sp.]HVI45499.1 class I SAM-dependent methyltransferase [Chitinophaga sp.]